mgnify:CR=1 FL=1
MTEYCDYYKKELIDIIELANTNSAALTDYQVAILFHWARHINDPEYEWVPDKYKVDMPQYKGVQK